MLNYIGVKLYDVWNLSLKYIKKYDEANYKKNFHYYKWVIDIWNPLTSPFYSLSMFEIFHKYKNGSEYNENIIINISYFSPYGCVSFSSINILE